MSSRYSGKILETHREHSIRMAKVQFGGISKQICLEYVPEVEVGDYVWVHVGFALARIDEEEAKRVFEMLATIGGLDELQDPPPQPPMWRRVEPVSAS